MACVFVVSIITLALPLCIRYITQNLLAPGAANAHNQIYMMGTLMLVLVVIYTACNAFTTHQGHVMGARMEGDMRNELFEHYQKLSFSFYDEHILVTAESENFDSVGRASKF